MPTLRQLEIFCEAAVDDNFRDTADRLGISQPAISSHIHALERKVGCKLFVRRRGTPAALSEEGHRLLATARETLALNRTMTGSFAAGQKQRVVVGMRHYLLETTMRAAIPAFLDANPDIDLDVRVVDDVAELIRLVRHGSLDAAIYRGDPPAQGDLVARSGRQSRCSIVAAPDLARTLVANRLPLSDAPFILLPDTSRAPNWILRRLRDVGIEPGNVVLRSQFPNIVLQWVLEGRGLAVLFDEAIAPHLQAQRLERVGPAIEPVSTQILTVPHAREAVTRAIAFLEGRLGG